MARDPRWESLERARPALIAALSPSGVERIEYVAAWPDLEGVAVWLCTATDAARDALGVKNPLHGEVEVILRQHGLDDRDLGIGRLVTTAQSQETVDRDFDGSWLYALR